MQSMLVYWVTVFYYLLSTSSDKRLVKMLDLSCISFVKRITLVYFKMP